MRSLAYAPSLACADRQLALAIHMLQRYGETKPTSELNDPPGAPRRRLSLTTLVLGDVALSATNPISKCLLSDL